MSKLFAGAQNLGKSFMLPIAVLPAAGLLLGFGGVFTNPVTLATYPVLNNELLQAIFTVMKLCGSVVFDNLALLFAVGIAVGMARSDKGTAGLAAVLCFIVMNKAINTCLLLSGTLATDNLATAGQASVMGITTLQTGGMGGIMSGLLAYWVQKRFGKTELPNLLAFFSGSRFVPIVSSFFAIFLGVALFWIWPPVQMGITHLGGLVEKTGYIGTLFYGMILKCLIPLGLYHLFYLPFWLTSVGGETMVNGPLIEGTQDLINRAAMPTQEEHFTHRTISAGIEFLETNQHQDNWLLQIECFDPHEPFFVLEKYLAQYGCKPEDFDGWVPYYCGAPGGAEDEKVRKFYQALITLCDDYLGQLVDKLKALDIWDDTLFIVCTDHGFLLGEYQWWGKNIMPVYNEIANTPFFIRDPRIKAEGVRRSALAQTIDIPATQLEYFGLPLPSSMTGKPLRPAIENDSPVRDYALYGYYGGHINITDGNAVYMRCPRKKGNAGLFEYTLMPTRIDSMFKPGELKNIRIHPGFDFTQGAQVMQIPATFSYLNPWRFGDMLFDLRYDPQQKHALHDSERAFHLAQAMKQLMQEHDAPPELYARFELDGLSRAREQIFMSRREKGDHRCEDTGVQEALCFVLSAFSGHPRQPLANCAPDHLFTKRDVFALIDQHFTCDQHKALVYQTRLLLRTE